ncbi:hypothetical protein F0Q45_10310 [Mycobacterium simiae]|uniref:Uncharacterized protein n=1 Tax=Mycobacterium simiae TaxID=1784 RepID=A0A5B1BSI6_MYCSI|nr:hypothetical protein [Mycobacterium simiae]KAA1250323.1 hypothetical protein F0Q45_10310 [Mycobacterium simiae]
MLDQRTGVHEFGELHGGRVLDQQTEHGFKIGGHRRKLQRDPEANKIYIGIGCAPPSYTDINKTMHSNSPLPTSSSWSLPAVPDHRKSQAAAEVDLRVLREYIRAIKTACDDLHGDPFDQRARAELVSMIQHQSDAADAAYARLQIRQTNRTTPELQPNVFTSCAATR